MSPSPGAPGAGEASGVCAPHPPGGLGYAAGLHASTLRSESCVPSGMARPPPRPQSLSPTPADPLLTGQVLDISPLPRPRSILQIF